MPCLAFCLTDLDTHPPSPSVLLTCLFWPIMHLYSLCNNCGPPPFCLLFSPASCFHSLSLLALQLPRLFNDPHLQQVALHIYPTIDLLPCCATVCGFVLQSCASYMHIYCTLCPSWYSQRILRSRLFHVLFPLVA